MEINAKKTRNPYKEDLKSKEDFWNPKKDAKIQAKKTFEIQRKLLKSKEGCYNPSKESTYKYLGHVTKYDFKKQIFE